MDFFSHFWHLTAKVLVAPMIFMLGQAGYDVTPHVTTVYEQQPVMMQQVPEQQTAPLLGSAVPVLYAFYTDSLASGIGSADTSMTLVRGTDAQGRTIAGTIGFVIDEGTSAQEVVQCTASGTALTNCTRGIDVLTGTTSQTSLEQAHHRGASVKITNAPFDLIIGRIVNGVDTFPNVVSYTPGTDCIAGHATNAICSGAYLETYANSVIAGGAPTSTVSVGGKVLLATQVQMASSTNLGVTAPTVLQSQYSSSSPSVVCGLCTVVSQNDGKISQSYIRLTDAWTITGTTTLGRGFIASSTQPADASTINLDWGSSNTFTTVLGGNRTITFSDLAVGEAVKFVVCQDSTGSRTLTWPSGIRWASGFAPTLTTTAGKCDTVSFFIATSTTSVFGAITTNF